MTKRSCKLSPLAVALLIIVGSAVPASSQTTTYWTDAFGNRAQLLGGAVIASDESLSSVFYNPGLLGTSAGSDLIITGNIFEAESLSVKEVSLPEREVSTTRFRLLPSMVAGEIFGQWLGDNRLAYSFFTRSDSRLRTNSNFGEAFQGENLLPPVDFFSDEVRVDSSMSEYWGGFTWGRSIGKRHGIGASMFVGARNQRSRLQKTDQAIFNDGTLGISYEASDLDFNNYRLFWKLGYSTEWEGWRVGATLTTPAINLFGSGKLNLDDSLVLSNGSPLNQITTSFQEDLSTEWKTPLSIGLGGARDWGPWSLHFSLEWFDSVAPFTVIQGEEFASQTTGEVFDPSVSYAAESVVNFAIGVERLLESGVRYYGSFRTDFGAGTEGDDTNLAVADFDLYHIGGGASFKAGTMDLTLGLAYAFGTSSQSDLGIDADELKFNYNRLTLVLGFDLPTGKNRQASDEASDVGSPYEGSPPAEATDDDTDS